MTTPPLTITPFTEAHIPAALAITNPIIRHTHIHFAHHEQTEADWLDSLRTNNPRHPFLAALIQTPEDRLQCVAYARAYTWRARSAYDNTAETAVYVHPDHHRKGIARALYTALLSELRHRGFHTAIAGISLPNPPSVTLHQSLGYTHIGTAREVGRKFDQWHDVAFYQVML